MRDKELYTQILGIRSPWQVADVELSVDAGEVKVYVERTPGTEQRCPKCGKVCPGYDRRRRQWRHLDTCQFKTLLVAEVPRVECPEHGVVTVEVPWSEPGSGFTALFEALVIDWLREASVAAVSRRLGLSWNAIDGVMQRAVQRGLARRAEVAPTHIGVDETSFRKRHDYVTVVSDQDSGTVLHVADDRGQASLSAYYARLSEAQKAGIASVAMDMWPAYIRATLEAVPEAREKIAFDKFHVAKYLGDAVDKVRRSEHRALRTEGRDELTRTKHRWLMNPHNMSVQQWRGFKALRESTLKTARAWAIKEFGMSLWHYSSRTWAEKGWQRWLGWAVRSRLEPVIKVARTIKDHLWGIINAVVLKADNGGAESINSRIKMIKVRSRGFRSKERFRNAIYFHLGGLDLYPAGVKQQGLPT
ncbi:MAG TPA: ISL3 family transposase [Thiohalobacter sp.]|nr:ISL3 family transposase [Thiohalobacter sp.]